MATGQVRLAAGALLVLASAAALVAIASASAALLPMCGLRAERSFVPVGVGDMRGLAVVERLDWGWSRWLRWGRGTIVDTRATILSGMVPWNPQDPLRIAPFAKEFTSRGVVAASEAALVREGAPADAAVTAWRTESYGWPFAALGLVWCEGPNGAHAVEGGLDLRRDGAPPGAPLVAVPVRVLWGGFVLDTLVVAAAIALFAVAIPSARRWRRRRRGRCVRCDHQLHGAESCPECGRPVRP